MRIFAPNQPKRELLLNILSFLHAEINLKDQKRESQPKIIDFKWITSV